jgi:adenosylcobinamide amidohydrolase
MTGEFMRQLDLLGAGVKLVLKDNVLAVLSDANLSVVSSAVYNGGFKKVKAILNVQVPEGYSDRLLHGDPQNFVMDSSRKFGFAGNFLGMITAANIENFSLVTKKEDDIAVSVVATAGCSHAESAGEDIEVQKIEGTINIIVVIDGNPSESCLVAALATATEAKTAAIRDLDIRSRYSGDAATGTITDSLVVASTQRGSIISYGGPASKLGKLIGYCTRKAVKEAIINQNECLPCRSLLDRLKDRHLPLEKLASELSKVKSLGLDEQTLLCNLVKILRDEPLFASVLMAAVKIDEDVEKGLIPPEFGKIEVLGKNFGDLFSKQTSAKTLSGLVDKEEYDSVDLPPFLKQVLISMVKSALAKETAENLK